MTKHYMTTNSLPSYNKVRWLIAGLENFALAMGHKRPSNSSLFKRSSYSKVATLAKHNVLICVTCQGRILYLIGHKQDTSLTHGDSL